MSVLVGAFVLIVGVFLGRSLVISWTLRNAERELRDGAIGSAEQWLTWPDRIDADNSRAALLRAACHRHRGQRQQWGQVLDSLEQQGSLGPAFRREVEMGSLRWGEAADISAADFEALVEAGISQVEAMTAVIGGLLARQELQQARALLASWRPGPRDEAQALYLGGLIHWSEGETTSAMSEFEQALASQSRHEMARASLARLLEQEESFELALAHFTHLAAAASDPTSVPLDRARVLRKLGRLQEARALLPAPSPASAAVDQQLAIELAEREYESGNYAAARDWYARVDLAGAHTAETLRTAASALALAGEHAEAEQLFARVDNTQGLYRQIGELQRRLAIDPNDTVAAELLRKLIDPSQPAERTGKLDDSSPPQVSQLFHQQCAACHGTAGDGQGRAARFLHPRPSSFRAGRFALVSTLNHVPTSADLDRVLQRGIPGTAMPSFAHLSEGQRRQLIEDIQRLHRAGVRERLDKELLEIGDEMPEADIRKIVAELTTPGDVLDVPEVEPADQESLARGRDVYADAGCHQCHGEDGTSMTALVLFDADLQPTMARDLVHDPLKGGTEPESLYRRIRLGMPGTPHPANVSLADADMAALIHYCRFLSQEPKRNLTNHQRALSAAGGSVVAP